MALCYVVILANAGVQIAGQKGTFHKLTMVLVGSNVVEDIPHVLMPVLLPAMAQNLALLVKLSVLYFVAIRDVPRSVMNHVSPVLKTSVSLSARIAHAQCLVLLLVIMCHVLCGAIDSSAVVIHVHLYVGKSVRLLISVRYVEMKVSRIMRLILSSVGSTWISILMRTPAFSRNAVIF